MPPLNRPVGPDRYGTDVLAPGWQQKPKKVVPEISLERGLVLEDARTGFCGAVTRWENGLVVLEGRGAKRRSFPIGPGLLLEGKPVVVKLPARVSARATGIGPGRTASGRTASGSIAGPKERAKVALPSRIYVEGRHDAELVEKIWGDDLRHCGVVVEFMDGIDDLADIVAEFAPEQGRRLGVLADHLVPGSKESRIAASVTRGRYADVVLVTGHPFVDIWQAVKPAKLGLSAWPTVPRGTDIKYGTCAALGWPHRDQTDIAHAWQRILADGVVRELVD
ncbi:MAG: DUF3097 domain-containing protein [Microlunatus sp.]|nr:DUF3097 domain-containing protein [Microlunatus sp.]